MVSWAKEGLREVIMADDFLGYELEEWLPTPPMIGPPLPIWIGITWPWYKPPVAEFRVSDLVISPSEVEVGQPVTISCNITNVDTEAGDYTLKMGGDFMAEKTITLAPDESQIVSFEVTPAVTKDYSVTVDGLTGTFRASELPVADIRVENLVIEPSEVYVGETVRISVTATNYGEATGSKRIVCEVT